MLSSRRLCHNLNTETSLLVFLLKRALPAQLFACPNQTLIPFLMFIPKRTHDLPLSKSQKGQYGLPPGLNHICMPHSGQCGYFLSIRDLAVIDCSPPCLLPANTSHGSTQTPYPPPASSKCSGLFVRETFFRVVVSRFCLGFAGTLQYPSRFFLQFI